MPRKTNTDKKSDKRGTRENRTPRPKPKIDFTLDALDYKNVTLLRTFVTDQGRALPAPHDHRYQARSPDAVDEVIFYPPPRQLWPGGIFSLELQPDK